ncbi:uncharacterized protein LOC115775196 isoform X2 [Archocentrus centrarchus]|nr:uncharacterized protein LOC115775196 isoform X2 [Archocentrus centrarchus]XP_030578609.1 uncharacterized protein LOC115775196 isoform X2 [Archocentrus centrarchus]
MEDRSSTQSFSNLNRHRPSFSLTFPSCQGSEVGYLSSQPGQDPLEQYECRGEESTTSFLTSNTSSATRKTSTGGDRGFLSTSASSLDGAASFGGHLEGDSDLGGHFDESWWQKCGKKEVWEDKESCESSANGKGDCYGNTNDVFYTINCSSEEGARRRVRATCNNYAHVKSEAKSDTVYNREANISHFSKQTASYNRIGAVSFNDSSVEYCENYLGRDENYESSCCSGEEHFQSAEAEGAWLNVSPSSQGESRWRAAAVNHTLASGCLPQRSLIGINSRTYTQKLDSFSEAFLSQRKRRFPLIPSGDATGQIWEFGVGRGETSGLVKSRQSCAFDSDSYLPPSSSSSSPAHSSSFPSFPSPPTSSHLMSSVLSPPPTPLPPPSHSPSKMDSPSAYGGTGQSLSQAGESLGMLQFFAPRISSVPSVHSSGMIWKFPLLPHSFPQPSSDPGNTDRSSLGDDYGDMTAVRNSLQSPESTVLTPTSHCSSLHPPRAVCSSGGPSPNASFHLPSHPHHLSGEHHETSEKSNPHVVAQKVKNGPASLNQSHLQQQDTPVYTGRPFPSLLHSYRGQKRGRYTPHPLLNPARRGTGLFSSISCLHHREEETACGEEEEECSVLSFVNVGPDFQANLPPCFADGRQSGQWLPEEGSLKEQLLWKPLDKKEEAGGLPGQVEKMLSMCSSSCLPGGGSNAELALHCLHTCQGDTMATLEMLLFSQPSPAGDYHYSGCDFWTDTERTLFSEALGSCGKDFSLIQKMVRTKTARQCVEFYYLSKKLQDKQKKQKEEEGRDAELEQQKSVRPICQPVDKQFALEGAVPVPSLASFFPCKLCGKMFYKIKSRNAHMKIHRQPQEDWTDRRLQHQLLTQRLALSRPTNLMPTPASNLLPAQAPGPAFSSSDFAGTSSNSIADSVRNSVTSGNSGVPSNANVLDPSTVASYSNIAPPDTHGIASINGNDSNQRESTTVLPFHQSWGSFGHPPEPSAFYCNTEGKEDVGAGTVGGKQTANWQ